MLINLLNISFLVMAFVFLAVIRSKRKPKGIRIPKNHNDTTGAHYAINENGYLERIQHDKLSRHAN
jgi:hypothetical protein